jgi:ESX-1-secreted protein regulator
MTASLAERIDCLFRTHRSPRGREYTYREVANAVSGLDSVTFSPAYLWQLRTGAKDNPTIRHLEALARFFNVSPSYFFDEELTELPETELRLLAASKSELLRPVAASLMGLSPDSLATVLQVACRLRQLEGLPCVDGIPNGGSGDGARPTPSKARGRRARRIATDDE